MAFPTAEGFGRDARITNDYTVHRVTNLDGAGAGSFRAAVEASGPRIVVFDVGGTIELDNAALTVDSPRIYIAGQTAPGDGICIKKHPDRNSTMLGWRASHGIVRHLRFRAGPSTTVTSAIDTIELRNCANVIFDHCSLSWSTDEVLSAVYGVSDVTYQWCIVAEGLNDSNHVDGAPHGYGLFLSSTGEGPWPERISIHHNLMAHNLARSPRISAAGPHDIVNNLTYNWGNYGLQFAGRTPGVQHNAVVGNWFKAGPSRTFITGKDAARLDTHTAPSDGYTLFAEGNIAPQRPTLADPESDLWNTLGTWGVAQRAFTAPPITTTSAAQAYLDVLAGAGCRVPALDAADARIIADVENGTGGLVDHPNDVGGWPTLASGTPVVPASGHEIVPQSYVDAHSLSPGDERVVAPNGYLWVENYLNELAGDPV